MKETPENLARMRQLVSYDPATGIFTWLPRPLEMFSREQDWKAFRSQFEGRTAGTFDSKGYVVIHCVVGSVLAHRLAYAFVQGEWPTNLVDHADGVTSNNREANIRSARHCQNLWNSKTNQNNTSGRRGVAWAAYAGKWRAYVTNHGKRKYLGYFACLEAAAEAVQVEITKTRGEFARYDVVE